MTAIASSFCAIKATHVFALVTSSKRCGGNSMHAHVQLSCIYLVSILDLTHVIKCTRLSSSLAERAWEGG